LHCKCQIDKAHQQGLKIFIAYNYKNKLSNGILYDENNFMFRLNKIKCNNNNNLGQKQKIIESHMADKPVIKSHM